VHNQLGQFVHQPLVYLTSKYLFKDPLPHRQLAPSVVRPVAVASSQPSSWEAATWAVATDVKLLRRPKKFSDPGMQQNSHYKTCQKDKTSAVVERATETRSCYYCNHDHRKPPLLRKHWMTRLHRRRHISLTFFTKCEWTQSLWLHRKRKHKHKAKEKTNQDIANDFNSLQQCCNVQEPLNNYCVCCKALKALPRRLCVPKCQTKTQQNVWSLLLLHKRRWHSCLLDEYARPRERARKWVSLREREREEWREATLISSAPRFSSSPTSLSFFSHRTTFHPNSNENSKTFPFPSWKRLHGMRYADEENR
jgi:hypothetical protein